MTTEDTTITTRLEATIAKLDDDRHLVFGWANLPRPASLEKSFDGSLEAVLEQIAMAYTRQAVAPPSSYGYVVATYATTVIAVHENYETGECGYFEHAYAQVGDAIVFGEGVPVELAFIYKTMGEGYISENLKKALPESVYAESVARLGKEAFDAALAEAKAGRLKEDLQGDIMPMDTLENAAYEFVLKSRTAGVDHERDGDAPRAVGKLVESFFATVEKYVAMGIPADVAESLNQGWFVGFYVEDAEIWKAVKDGTYSMFSVGGHGKRSKKA